MSLSKVKNKTKVNKSEVITLFQFYVETFKLQLLLPIYSEAQASLFP